METVLPMCVGVRSRHSLVRIGLTGLVQSGGDLARVVDITRPESRLAGVDVVVYDLAGQVVGHPPDDLHGLARSVPVVGLAREGRADLVEAAHAAGVALVVDDTVSADELFDALWAATGRGRRPRIRAFDPRVLSERERSVLGLVGSGLSNAEIAKELIVSGNTVKTYIRAAYRKIGVTSRPQAVLWVMRHGLAAASRPPRNP